MEYETVAVATFYGRMMQHTMPKGFKRIRYDGVQATKTFAKVKEVIQAALAKVEKVVKAAVENHRSADLPAAVRAEHGRDPLRCPHCQHEMGVWCIWHRPMG